MSKVVVLCVPFAGAGASFFRPWVPLAPKGVEFAAVQLPGRERRFAEDAYRNVGEAVTGLLPEVRALVGAADRFALFGHSLGAVVAYELAHRLAAGGAEPAALVVSGSPGPWTRREDGATGLSDEEFLARVKDFAGYRHDALEEPEMRELLLPSLRADVEMHESYVPASAEPLPVPITSVRGRSDALVSADQAAEWNKATSRSFELVELDGGHMYLIDGALGAIEIIRDAVSRG